MRKFLAILFATLLIFPASAAGWLPLVAKAPYVGPGDVVPGFAAWWGLRAYNVAYATGSNNAINIRRASDNTTINIVILSSGNLDVATATTFCASTTCYVVTLYDQTGNGWTLTQATTADQAQLSLSCINSLPCMIFNGTSDSYLNTAGNISILMSVYMVVQPATNSANYVPFGNMQTGANNSGHYLELAATTSTVGVTSVASGTSSSGGVGGAMNTSWGVAAAAWNDAGNSRYPFLNGTQGSQDGTSIAPTTQNSTSFGSLYRNSGQVAYYSGFFTELGELGSYSLNPTQTTICHNAYHYWGTAVFC